MSKKTSFLIAFVTVLTGANAMAMGGDTELSGMAGDEQRGLTQPVRYVKAAAEPNKVIQSAPGPARAISHREDATGGEETAGMSGMTADERNTYRTLNR